MKRAIIFLILALGCGDGGLAEAGSVCAGVYGGQPSSIERSTVKLSQGCTGTLIAPDVVLSAAHCGPALEILAGGVWHEVAHGVAHPDFHPQTLVNDLALHFLTAPVKTLPTAPIRVPVLGPALLQGYGQTEAGISGTLNEAPMEIRAFYQDGRLLAGGQGTDSCYGDSGGPLYQDGALVGVASSGIPGGECGDGGLYTAPARFLEWIESKAGELGNAEGC